MFSPVDFFNQLDEHEGVNEELLNRIMTIKSPMDFKDNFATDEELDDLIRDMEQESRQESKVEEFKKTIVEISPSISPVNYI